MSKFFDVRYPEQAMVLTPAYDLLATKLLMPDDQEELALSMNGKKSRFRQEDWTAFAVYLGLTDKQRTNIYQRFSRRLPAVYDWIRTSFLEEGTRYAYEQLIISRSNRLGL